MSISNDETIRILDLRDSPWVDGPGRTILEIAEALNADGFELVIGSLGRSEAPGPYAEQAKRLGLPLELIEERGPIDPRALPKVLEILRRRRTHILHTHESRSNLIGLLCARWAGVRLVTTAHGWIANNLKGKAYVLIDKLLLRFFDRIVVVSELMKRQLLRWGIPARKIVVVPNALRLEHYRPDRADDGYRRELGVGLETMLIANIGRLSPEKGQADFLRAAQRVLQHHAKAKFVLIGIGPDEQELRELAHELGIEASVVFAGYRKDMTHVYNSLDLVVQSSYTEGMPNVVLEALLMEVPVIATAVGGTGEILEHNQHGVLVAPGSPEILSTAIAESLDDPIRMREMAKRGAARIRERFDSQARIQRMRGVYRELASENP